MEVDGHCDRAFAPVRDVFLANFEAGEIGAACAVVVDGRTVVDIWGGWADEQRTRAWQRDTIVNAYSVGKPVVALAVLQCVAAGTIQLDEPATRWWPELVAGQQGATVRDVLCHRAGIPAIRDPLTDDALWDWTTMTDAVAAIEPWWQPGTRHGYHVNTYGYLTGELARRVTAMLPGDWLRNEVAGPLGMDAMWGVPAADQPRCADIVWEAVYASPTVEAMPAHASEEQQMIWLSYFNPPGFSSIGVVNTPEWRATQVPSTNLHTTARALARLYTAFAAGGTIDGITVLDADVLAEATRPQSEGWCPFLEREVTFGLGFQPTRPDRPFGPNPGSFGHFGTGGALGFADPVAGVAFGYVMNAVKPRWQNSRNRALVDAVYACLMS
ncbi:MAG TPA: serine hydrolase domain-containing protein [Acidimicrobiia bacterium]|nr:serine hydrolase domain-containing protein [Acidimicrobiia bacterium]